MSRKPFDPTSYKYGRPGEHAVRHWADISGLAPREKPHGLYGPDVTLMQDGIEYVAEIERMKASRWMNGSDDFRWPELNQLADRRIGPNVIQFQCSSDCKVALVSFYDDHRVAITRNENNRENTDEPIRKLPIERALPVSLLTPAQSTLAEMNRLRVRHMAVSAETPAQLKRAKRALVGNLEDQYGPPFGMSTEEWIDLQQLVESQMGVLRDLKDGRRDPARSSRRPVQMSLF
jgi:hypothetical protein